MTEGRLPRRRVGTPIAGVVESDGPSVSGQDGKHLPEFIHGTRRLVEEDEGRPLARARLDAVDLTHRGVAEEAA